MVYLHTKLIYILYLFYAILYAIFVVVFREEELRSDEKTSKPRSCIGNFFQQARSSSNKATST